MKLRVENGLNHAHFLTRRDARVVEEARLESVYTPKGFPGFESPSRRNERLRKNNLLFKSTLVHVHSAGTCHLRARYPR